MNSRKSYIIYGSLWNFDTSFKEERFKVMNFDIRRLERVSIDLDPQKLISAGIPIQDVTFLSTLLFLYQSQPNRDFPHFFSQDEFSFEGDFDFSIADGKIKGLLTSLRLYNSGDVQGRLIFTSPKNDKLADVTPLDSDSFPGLQNKYILDSIENLETFAKSLDGLNDLIDTLAIDRFNISYSHYNSPRERLLDLITVLESLFNKSPYDIKFKIALRTSHLLYPKKSEQTQELYEFLLSAYNLRNKIVHGLGEINQSELMEKTNRLIEIVRVVLKEAILLRSKKKIDLFEKSNDKFEREIDKVILNT